MYRHLPPTHILQCQLSTVDADVEDAWIFVVPSMSGLTYVIAAIVKEVNGFLFILTFISSLNRYIFYSYPVTSYTIGTVIVFCLEVLCILIWMQRQKMVKVSSVNEHLDTRTIIYDVLLYVSEMRCMMMMTMIPLQVGP